MYEGDTTLTDMSKEEFTSLIVNKFKEMEDKLIDAIRGTMQGITELNPGGGGRSPSAAADLRGGGPGLGVAASSATETNPVDVTQTFQPEMWVEVDPIWRPPPLDPNQEAPSKGLIIRKGKTPNAQVVKFFNQDGDEYSMEIPNNSLTTLYTLED